MTILDFPHRCRSVALSIHVFGEVVCPLSVAGLEGEINLSRCRENIAQFIVFSEKIGICKGILVQKFEDAH